MQREPNTEYILSLSYGKDSLACLEAIKKLGYPLDRIIHAEVWATDTIPADLPPMVEFKAYADKIIKEKYGIEVEHICAVRGGKKLTYEIQFYEWINTGKNKNRIYGFPYTLGAWCNSRLKVNALSRIGKDDIRKIVLSHSESQKETTRERERERETAGSDTEQVAERIHNSKSLHYEQSILGFPIPRGTWCNSNLKLAALRVSNLNRQRELVYPAQTEGFQIAPLCEAQRKISCSTLE